MLAVDFRSLNTNRAGLLQTCFDRAFGLLHNFEVKVKNSKRKIFMGNFQMFSQGAHYIYLVDTTFVLFVSTVKRATRFAYVKMRIVFTGKFIN